MLQAIAFFEAYESQAILCLTVTIGCPLPTISWKQGFIKSNLVNELDWAYFSWKHYEMFMKHIQYVILNPFWCVDNGFQYSYQELVDHDSAKLLDNALSTFDEKYKNIKKIQLHHFYLQQTGFNLLVCMQV